MKLNVITLAALVSTGLVARLSEAQSNSVAEYIVPGSETVVGDHAVSDDVPGPPIDGHALPEAGVLDVHGGPEVAHVDGDCADCADGHKPKPLIDKAKQAERKHARYLQSVRGGWAEYTHQWNMYYAQQYPWHGGYYHTEWGRPVALLVPPTAEFQTNWSWGVGRTTVTPIYHQFSRPFPGEYSNPGMQFRATPRWPSHTDQFGVYYVRGPW